MYWLWLGGISSVGSIGVSTVVAAGNYPLDLVTRAAFDVRTGTVPEIMGRMGVLATNFWLGRWLLLPEMTGIIGVFYPLFQVIRDVFVYTAAVQPPGWFVGGYVFVHSLTVR